MSNVHSDRKLLRARLRATCASTAFSVLLAASQPAVAQVAAGGTPTPDQQYVAEGSQAQPSSPSVVDTGQLGEIIVTARKTNENLQRAAISVTALNGSALSNTGIKDPMDLQTKLPAVQFQSSNVPSVLIRGVGTYNNQSNVDSAVAYSYDGTYISHLFGLPSVLYDIQRVEVLRGPQGTLLGRNSNGGAVNFITNRPSDRFEASAALTVGNYDTKGTELMLNAPVGDKVAVRVAFGSDDHDGYVGDGYNNAHNYGGRVRALYTPTSNLELLATVDYERTKGNGQQFSYCPPRAQLSNPACAGVPWRPYDGLENVTPAQPADFFSTKNFGAYGEANLKLAWATLTSITNYRRYNTETFTHFYPLGYSPNHIDKFFTQELRIASPSSSVIKWVGGAFYSHERLVGHDDYDIAGVPFLKFVIPGSLAKSEAVFGQVIVPLAEKFRVTGGARYTYELKSSFGFATAYDGAGAGSVFDTGGKQTQKRVTWKGGVDYDVSDTSLLYASASNGFKSGGVNQVPVNIGIPTTYGPEKIVAYQAGSKNRFLDNHLQINAEGFYYDYTGYQTYVTLSDPTGFFPGIFFSNANSQKATFYGGEIEASASFSRTDRLDLSLALLHAKFDRFLVAGLDYSGNRPQASPKFTIGGSYQHDFLFTDGSKVTFGVDSQLVGGNYVEITNTPGSYQPRYTRTNANLTWVDAADRWHVSAFVRNLENKARLSAYGGVLGPPGDLTYVYPPRTFGVTVGARIR